MAATAKAADAMRAGASKTRDAASNALETYDFYADAALDYGWDVGRSKFAGDSALSKAGQVGTMLTVVTLGLSCTRKSRPHSRPPTTRSSTTRPTTRRATSVMRWNWPRWS